MAARRAQDRPSVEIRRSRRRRRTVSAYRNGDTVVVLMPAGLSAAAEQRHVDDLLAKMQRRERRVQASDVDLAARAERLRATLLPEVPAAGSVRFVDNQQQRWGSCTEVDRSIRVSSRLRQLPRWVLDYVLVHELVHLVESAHGERFHQLVARYPEAARAQGFLHGYELGRSDREPGDAPDVPPVGDPVD